MFQHHHVEPGLPPITELIFQLIRRVKFHNETLQRGGHKTANTSAFIAVPLVTSPATGVANGITADAPSLLLVTAASSVIVFPHPRSRSSPRRRLGTAPCLPKLFFSASPPVSVVRSSPPYLASSCSPKLGKLARAASRGEAASLSLPANPPNNASATAHNQLPNTIDGIRIFALMDT